MASANSATMPAPSVPARIPSATHRPRPFPPRTAARTIPINSPATITSRNTIMSAPNMPLFRDDDAFAGVRVEITEELVAPRRQRSDTHHPFGLARNDLLDLERRALEFLRACVLVGDLDCDPFPSRHADVLRLELVVAD